MGLVLVAPATATLLVWHGWSVDADAAAVQEAEHGIVAAVVAVHGRGAAGWLLRCPLPLITLCVAINMLLPIAGVVFGCSALSRAAAARPAGLLRRFILAFSALALLVLMSYAVVAAGTITLALTTYQPGSVVEWALGLWLRSTLHAAPFLALGVSLGLLRSRLTRVTLTTLAAFLLPIVGAVLAELSASVARLLPTHTDGLLLDFSDQTVRRGVVLACGWTVLALLLGAYIRPGF